MQIKITMRDFLGGPVIKNLLCNAGDMGLIPGQETDVTCQGATKPGHCNIWTHTLQWRIHMPQLRPYATK